MFDPIGWPLQWNKIRRGMVNHTFGMVRDGGKRAHQGWDLEAVPGTPIFAVADGVVHVVTEAAGGDYGLQLSLEFAYEGVTLFAQYCHLSKVFVSEGQTVKRNDILGHTGNTGNAKNMKGADQHLHFEVRTRRFVGRGLANRLNPIDVYRQTPPLTAGVLDLHNADRSVSR